MIKNTAITRKCGEFTSSSKGSAFGAGGAATSTYPRVLIINNRPFNSGLATGITITNLFADWPRDRIAQIYADDTFIDNEICTHSWQMKFEDRNITGLLRGAIRRYRRIPDRADPSHNRAASHDSSQTAANIFGIRKSITSCVARLINLLPYGISKELRCWVLDFRPEVIYSLLEEPHITRLVRDLGNKFNIPIVPHIVDDWLHDNYSGSCKKTIRERRLRRDTEWIIRHAPVRLAIGELMAEEYNKRYGLPFLTFMNCVDTKAFRNQKHQTNSREEFHFVYTGGLLLGRLEMLLDIAQALSVIANSGKKATIDTYTTKIPDDMLAKVSAQKIIRFWGIVPPDKIKNIIESADGLLHVESFEEKYKNYTRYSVSTKLPEYFASGTAIFSYGPEDVASIKYIATNNCGAVVGNRSQLLLTRTLQDFIDNDLLRSKMAEHARILCKTNHDACSQKEKFRRVLVAAITSSH